MDWYGRHGRTNGEGFCLSLFCRVARRGIAAPVRTLRLERNLYSSSVLHVALVVDASTGTDWRFDETHVHQQLLTQQHTSFRRCASVALRAVGMPAKCRRLFSLVSFIGYFLVSHPMSEPHNFTVRKLRRILYEIQIDVFTCHAGKGLRCAQ